MFNAVTSHGVARRLRTFASALLVLGLMSACASDGEKKSGGESSSGGDLTLRRVDFNGGSFQALDLTVIVAVKNDTSGPMKISGGDVEVAILRRRDEPADAGDESGDGDEPIGDASVDGEDAMDDEDAAEAAKVNVGVYTSGTGPAATVEAGTVAEYPLRLSFPLPDDPAELEALLAWKNVVLDIKGGVQIGGASETFAGERELSLPEFPVMVVSEAHVASENGGQNGSAFFVIGIENPNIFNLDVDAFAWGVKINGKELEPMGAGSPEEVPPSTVSSFEDTVQLTTETYGPDVQTLLNESTVPYEVTAFIEVAGIRREKTFKGEMAFPR